MSENTNFMNFENLNKLIEEHRKETIPYKNYEFDNTSYTLLLININNLLKENQKSKNQQKEFIKYLENEINKLKEQIKNYDIWYEVGTDINFLILKKQFYLEILQKYKSIIGVSDEKEN